MRRLWHESDGGPIDEGDIAAALEAVGGRSYAGELAAWVHGTGELPLAELLPRFGVGGRAPGGDAGAAPRRARRARAR